ncbi:MAG: hypothetical protein E7578_09235 [Ruminococcaceae bacterium]|nr:hypothetical protein [Oscillospiraceae bacterium]
MKKLSALFLSFLMVVNIAASSVSAVSDSEEEVAVTYIKQYDSQKAVKHLEEIVDVAKLKEYILKNTYECSTSIDISSFNIPNSAENANYLFDLILNETPENFHLGNKMSYSYSSTKIKAIKLTYDYTASEYQKMLEELVAAKDKLLTGIKGNTNLDDVEKALLIHDRLALLCEYDYTDTPNKYNSYGALVVGTAVCQGYAVAYDYLLENVGIESYYCSSDDLNHGWNIVYINDVPYHVDVTWDDYAWGNGKRGAVGVVVHDNFLRSTAGIYSTGHEAYDYDSFPTDTTYDNYFWQNSETAFQLIDNEIYYIDNTSAELKRYSDQKTLCSVSSMWANDRYYWNNQARLSGNGSELYYSLSDAIYKYDVSTNTSSKIFEPELPDYNCIYGFEYSDGYLICDINNGAPYSGYLSDLYQIKEAYDPDYEEAPANAPGDANGDGAVNAIDALLLARKLSGSNETISENADYNGDGTVSAADLALLRRKLTGADI